MSADSATMFTFKPEEEINPSDAPASYWGQFKDGFRMGWSSSNDKNSHKDGSSQKHEGHEDDPIRWKQLRLLQQRGLGSSLEARKINRRERYYGFREGYKEAMPPGEAMKPLRDCEGSVGKVLEKIADKVDELEEKYLICGNECYNEWQLKYDDSFAKAYYDTLPIARTRKRTIQCCSTCKAILATNHRRKGITMNLNDFVASAERCRVCSLILRSSIEAASEDGTIQLFRSYEALRAGVGGRRLLRLCADPGSVAHDEHRIPIGYPIVSNNRDARFNLLRAWLRQCDKSHACFRKSDATIFPTRVLDVGSLEDVGFAPGWIRLIHAEDRKSNDYVALSHCWGNLSAAQKMFCTSQSNLAARQQAFHVSELPRTFRDAVKVVRAVGLRYLWIDSLCIVQSGDGGEDWRREATKMQSVFSEAYFVIAATVASDSYSGFLDKNENSVESFEVDGGTYGQFRISSDIDDYDRDVLGAVINTRAWVMQESVLARRTIHFTSNQMYWECGQEVYCENLTILKSSVRGRHFIMDPIFPFRLLESGNSSRPMVHTLTTLFEDYSRRSITVPTDRPIAISGLENRIQGAFFCDSRFGVIDKQLHRLLLWETITEGTKIEYDSPFPSWSWLSRSGGVKFYRPESIYSQGFGLTFELNSNVKFNTERRDVVDADLGVLLGCTLKLEDEHWALLDAAGTARGVLNFDVKGAEHLDNLHCVVVAKVESNDGGTVRVIPLSVMYAVLVVVPSGSPNEYTRVGIGRVPSEWIIKVQDEVHII